MAKPQHRFSYQFIDDTKFLRPYIPVTLRMNAITLQPVFALVDSGADFSVFDGELFYLLAGEPEPKGGQHSVNH